MQNSNYDDGGDDDDRDDDDDNTHFLGAASSCKQKTRHLKKQKNAATEAAHKGRGKLGTVNTHRMGDDDNDDDGDADDDDDDDDDHNDDDHDDQRTMWGDLSMATMPTRTTTTTTTRAGQTLTNRGQSLNGTLHKTTTTLRLNIKNSFAVV